MVVSYPVFRGFTKGWFSKKMVLADVPLERKPERGYVRMFPRNENRNEGTFACSPGTKTRTRVHSPKPTLLRNRPFDCLPVSFTGVYLVLYQAFLNLGFAKPMFCNSVLFTKTTGITKMTKMTKTTQTATSK